MKSYAIALCAMLFAAAMQWLSLALFDSLALSFILYTLLACVCLPVFDLLILRRTQPKDLASLLRLVPATRKQALFASLLGIGMDLIMFAAFFLLGSLFLREGRALEVLGRWGIRPGWAALIYFAALVINGGVEELFWRGYVHYTLEGSKDRALAIVLPALIFGGQHFFVISRLVPNPLSVALFMFAIIASGFLWGIIREKTKSLFACVLCHMIVAVGYLSILGLYLFS